MNKLRCWPQLAASANNVNRAVESRTKGLLRCPTSRIAWRALGRCATATPTPQNKNPAFTNVVVVEGNVKIVHIGGQDAVNASGEIIGKGDIVAQIEQILANLREALAAGGAGPEHIIKWNIYVLEGQPLQAGFAAFQNAWPQTPNPPAITGVFVSALAHPDFLVEMDAVAVVPQ